MNQEDIDYLHGKLRADAIKGITVIDIQTTDNPEHGLKAPRYCTTVVFTMAGFKTKMKKEYNSLKLLRALKRDEKYAKHRPEPVDVESEEESNVNE